MKQKMTGRINGWKWLCLALLALLLGGSFVVLNRMTTKREDMVVLLESPKEEEIKVGTFTTNREQLNRSVNRYLEEYQQKDFSYRLYATNQQVVFEGNYKMLGMTIPLYLYFQPSKLEDGSILLSISEISAGSLPVPKAEVLTYLKKHYKLPDFVVIDAKKARIYIQLPQIEHAMGFYAKVNTLDLYNDQIILDLYRKQ